MAGAHNYELVVYRVKDEGEEPQPVLRETFAGSVSSWTPSLELCLERGRHYAWSVRSVGRKEVSEWSTPNLFQVVEGPSPAEFEAALELVRNYLERTEGPASAASAEMGRRETAAGALSTAGAPSPRAAPGATQLSVDGNIDATSYTGDGENLTGVATDAELTAHAGGASAHHTPPTSLPPSGAAGGDLTGTYPDPSVAASIARDTEVTSAVSTHATLANAHHTPTVDTDTTCLDGGVTCNFAGSTSEGGAASVAESGDSATGFFATGQIEEPRIADAIARDSELALLLLCADGTVGGWRYWDMGDGTVLDCNTSLLWLKDASCAALGPNGDGTGDWPEAEAAAAALASGTCGLTDGSVAGDWRQPTALESCSTWDGTINYSCPPGAAPDSLIDASIGPPHVVNASGDAVWTEGDVFVGLLLSTSYWTSTADPNDLSGNNHMVFDFNLNFVNGDFALDYGVWPVREP